MKTARRLSAETILRSTNESTNDIIGKSVVTLRRWSVYQAVSSYEFPILANRKVIEVLDSNVVWYDVFVYIKKTI